MQQNSKLNPQQWLETAQTEIRHYRKNGTAGFRIICSYLKDLSFECPSLPDLHSEKIRQIAPDALTGDMEFKVRHLALANSSTDHFAVLLRASISVATGKQQSRTLYLAEVEYGTNLQFAKDVTATSRLYLLYCEIPVLLFPYLRQAALTPAQESNLPLPQMLHIDFISHFMARIEQHGVPQL